MYLLKLEDLVSRWWWWLIAMLDSAFSMDCFTTTNLNNDGGTEVRVKNYALMYVIKFNYDKQKNIRIYRT